MITYDIYRGSTCVGSKISHEEMTEALTIDAVAFGYCDNACARVMVVRMSLDQPITFVDAIYPARAESTPSSAMSGTMSHETYWAKVREISDSDDIDDEVETALPDDIETSLRVLALTRNARSGSDYDLCEDLLLHGVERMLHKCAWAAMKHDVHDEFCKIQKAKRSKR